MSLKEQIEEQTVEAMKTHKEAELSLLRMLKSSIKNAEIAKGHELSDEEVISVLEKEAKQRRDSIAQYEAGNRTDLADVEKHELELIEKYLPQKLGEEQIRELVKQVISEVKPTGSADFGKVMGAVMAKLKGQADGASVQKIVREELDG